MCFCPTLDFSACLDVEFGEEVVTTPPGPHSLAKAVERESQGTEEERDPAEHVENFCRTTGRCPVIDEIAETVEQEVLLVSVLRPNLVMA